MFRRTLVLVVLVLLAVGCDSIVTPTPPSGTPSPVPDATPTQIIEVVECPDEGRVTIGSEEACWPVGFSRETVLLDSDGIPVLNDNDEPITFSPDDLIMVNLTISEWGRCYLWGSDDYVSCTDVYFVDDDITPPPPTGGTVHFVFTDENCLFLRKQSEGGIYTRCLRNGEEVVVFDMMFETDVRGVSTSGGWCWLDEEHDYYAACKYLYEVIVPE